MITFWTPGAPEPHVYNSKWRRARMRCLVRDDFKCQTPGCDCNNLLLLTAHHIVPKSEGGTNELANLQTLCVYHHALLHDALPKGIHVAIIDTPDMPQEGVQL